MEIDDTGSVEDIHAFIYCKNLDKAPRLSISIVIWILSSDTICQLNQFNTNSEAAMLSNDSPYTGKPRQGTSSQYQYYYLDLVI